MADEKTTERAPPDLMFLNEDARVKVLSVADGNDIRQFMCVPTQTATVPGKFARALSRNMDAREILKGLKAGNVPAEQFLASLNRE